MNKIEQVFLKVNEDRSKLMGQVELLEKQIQDVRTEHDETEKQYKIGEQVIDALRKYSVLMEQTLRKKLDNVITYGLNCIFGQGYESCLEFSISRGQAMLQSMVRNTLGKVEFIADVEDGNGEGMSNVVSLIYRVLVLSLYRPMQKQILWLDECFRNLDDNKIESAGEFLRYLCDRLGMQMVLITHQKQLLEIGEKCYELELVDGETRVKE